MKLIVFSALGLVLLVLFGVTNYEAFVAWAESITLVPSSIGPGY